MISTSVKLLIASGALSRLLEPVTGETTQVNTDQKEIAARNDGTFQQPDPSPKQQAAIDAAAAADGAQDAAASADNGPGEDNNVEESEEENEVEVAEEDQGDAD